MSRSPLASSPPGAPVDPFESGWHDSLRRKETHVPRRTLSLEEISDRFEIQDLLTRYTLAIDNEDWNLLDTVFTPDAWVDYESSGGIKGNYPEIRVWLAQVLPNLKNKMHMVAPTHVKTIARDTASTRTYLHNPNSL